MSTMREALDRAMGHADDAAMRDQLAQDGIAVANEDTMSQAIHDVFCGIVADHDYPNEKDHAQARALLASLQGSVGSTA